MKHEPPEKLDRQTIENICDMLHDEGVIYCESIPIKRWRDVLCLPNDRMLFSIIDAGLKFRRLIEEYS